MSHLPSDPMAGEIVDLVVTSEATMSPGVELRRHSTGKARAGNNKEKVVPHYLRASTGSCHDFCKYGRKQVFEAKERSPIPKRAVRKQLHQSSEGSIDEVKILVAKPRASIDSKPPKVSAIKLIQTVDSEPLSYAFDTDEQEPPRKFCDSQRQIGNKVLIGVRKKTSLVKVNPLLLPNSRVSSFPNTRRQERSSTFKMEASSKSNSKKEETPLKSTSARVKTHPKSSSKKMVTSSNLSSKVEEMEFSEKHVISLNPNSSSMKTNASVKSSKDFGGQRSSVIKKEKREPFCKLALPLRVFLSSSKPSIRRIASTNARKHKSMKIVPHPKTQPKPRKHEPKEQNHEVEEKTLFVIKTKNESQTLQSDQSGIQDTEPSLSHSLSPHNFTCSSISQSSSQDNKEESEYSTSESEEDSSSRNYESDCKENGMKTLEAEVNGKPQEDGVVCFKDKECQLLKLKIISRKLGETHIEKSSPRMLKFRRGKVLCNNEAECPEKVVLRHQDVRGKKDGQVLFNDMIEETASKLVETRKSKVKALVGAFETVISLQEQNTLC